MTYLLLSVALGLQLSYDNKDVCQEALEQVQVHDAKAICIPAGKDKTKHMFDQFLDMVEQMQKFEQK